MLIGLFAQAEDPIAARIVEIASARGHSTLTVGFDAPFAWDGARWLARGRALDEAGAFVVRSYPLALNGVLEVERSHFAQSCLLDLEAAGKRFVNPLGASGPFDMKPHQLAAFTRAEIPVPATVITNAPAAVHAFRAAYPEVVFKPVAGGAETRVLDGEALSKLDAIREGPVIFQERIFGTDIRVTVVAGRVVSSVEIPGGEVDYRLGAAYRSGAQRYVSHALSTSVEAICLRAAAVCRQVLSGIDLKRRPSGEYVVLEANSAPVYLDIELKTGAPITSAIVDHLERA